MGLVIFLIFVGAFGTTLGGVIACIVGVRGEKTTSYLLAFAAGVMASVAFFELIPESIEMSNLYIGVGGIVWGALIVLFLNGIVDTVSSARNKKNHENAEELFHQTELIEAIGVQNPIIKKSRTDKQKNLLRSGIIVLIAITLHELPEGLAVGASVGYEIKLGVTIAIIMAVHNIPEGMAISVPLLSGGVHWGKVILLTLISSVPTFIGGVLGFALGELSLIIQACCLSVAAGAMLYVVFGEILPQSVATTKSRIPTVVALLGIIVGLIITQV